MPLISKYFNENRYQPKFKMGDRVHGVWNNIPFRGSIANDTVVCEELGPEVIIFLDLPIKYKNEIYNQITTNHKSIYKLGESFFKGKKK